MRRETDRAREARARDSDPDVAGFEPAGRTNFGSGAPWETRVGYSRAVRVGRVIHVAGTTALDDRGRLVGEGDPYAQARQILTNIERVLERAGARMRDVVRTRIYLKNKDHWKPVAHVHGRRFRDIMPTNTLINSIGPSR